MHSDFRLVERGVVTENDRLDAMRIVLRTAWTPPTDTFVTSTIPLLLSILAQPAVVGGPCYVPKADVRQTLAHRAAVSALRDHIAAVQPAIAAI